MMIHQRTHFCTCLHRSMAYCSPPQVRKEYLRMLRGNRQTCPPIQAARKLLTVVGLADSGTAALLPVVTLGMVVSGTPPYRHASIPHHSAKHAETGTEHTR